MKTKAVPTISRMSHYVPTPNAEHNSTTPPCRFCEEPHIGMHVECTVLLKGQFVFSHEQGMALFVLDPDADVAVLELPNRQLALVLAPSEAVRVTHDECITTMLREVGLAADDDYDDPEDDEPDEYEEL